MKQAIWRSGSFNSVYALQISLVLTNISKRSVKPGLLRCHFANGLITCGCSVMNVGLTMWSSMKWPHNLSRSLDDERGGGQSRFNLATKSSSACRAASEAKSLFNFAPAFFSISSTMEMRGHGGVKSISIG